MDLIIKNPKTITISELIAEIHACTLNPQEEFDASQCQLGLVNADILIEAFKTIPSHIKKINLGRNMLEKHTPSNLIKLFQSLPNTIHVINLNGNHLGQLKASDLSNVLSQFKKSITHLNLSDNSLKENNDQSNILKTLAPSINTLDLSYNYGCDLRKIYSSLPVTVTSLIAVYSLAEGSSDETLINTMQTLPRHLIKLNFGYNWLGDYKEETLIKGFQALPPALEYLNLALNVLNRLSGETLKKIFVELSSTTKTLDLCNNTLTNDRYDNLNALFPKQIETVNLGDQKILKFPYTAYSDEIALLLWQDISKIKSEEARNIESSAPLMPYAPIDSDRIPYIINFIQICSQTALDVLQSGKINESDCTGKKSDTIIQPTKITNASLKPSLTSTQSAAFFHTKTEPQLNPNASHPTYQ